MVQYMIQVQRGRTWALSPLLLTHGSQHVSEVIFADDTISVLVNDCESLREGGESDGTDYLEEAVMDGVMRLYTRRKLFNQQSVSGLK